MRLFLTFPTNRAHLNVDPLGLTYSMSPLIQMWWLVHVHKAMKRLSHTGEEMEMSFLCSSVKFIHRVSDWLTRRPSVICIRVVLLYSKRKWMICQRVCFILRFSFFIWVQWDHVENMYFRKRIQKEIFKTKLWGRCRIIILLKTCIIGT